MSTVAINGLGRVGPCTDIRRGGRSPGHGMFRQEAGEKRYQAMLTDCS